MKWSLMMRADVMQVNLEPENDHERKIVDMLAAHAGQATIHAGVNVDECRGGYLRNFGENNSLAITIKAIASAEDGE
jgi:hypothetical protein